jgi:hypothetical protein
MGEKYEWGREIREGKRFNTERQLSWFTKKRKGGKAELKRK